MFSKAVNHDDDKNHSSIATSSSPRLVATVPVLERRKTIVLSFFLFENVRNLANDDDADDVTFVEWKYRVGCAMLAS